MNALTDVRLGRTEPKRSLRHAREMNLIGDESLASATFSCLAEANFTWRQNPDSVVLLGGQKVVGQEASIPKKLSTGRLEVARSVRDGTPLVYSLITDQGATEFRVTEKKIFDVSSRKGTPSRTNFYNVLAELVLEAAARRTPTSV